MTFPMIGLFYVCGLLLLFLELFVPGGIIGMVGIGLSGYAIFQSFVSLPTIWPGVGMILFGITVVPVVAWRFLRRHQLQESLAGDEFVASNPSLQELVGKQGKTVTMLRPAGVAQIDGKRVDVVSQNRFIETDREVVVVDVKGMRVVVRETSR